MKNDLKYFEILKLVKELRSRQGNNPDLYIRVLSNGIVHQLKEVMEYALRAADIVPEIFMGNYDNILQDAANADRNEIIIVFWEAANFTDGFQYTCESFSEEQWNTYFEKIEGEFILFAASLKGQKEVIFNLFHALPFQNDPLEESAYEHFVDKLNAMVSRHAPPNFILLDTRKIAMELGLSATFDLRNYYSSKALYTIGFFKMYVDTIIPVLKSIVGNMKKVLVLDCDNTLWSGVLGEDGFSGIQMSSKRKEGVPFASIQHYVKNLAKRGVMLCLCSKNNQEEVDEVLQNHPDMVLDDADIVLKKINWEDKVSNLRAMSASLNVGLDSFVFVDDSDFEVNLVKEQLPEVLVFQVPKQHHLYPKMMHEIGSLFYNPFVTREDKNKALQYKSQEKRAQLKSEIKDIDAYIRNLGIMLTMYKNDASLVARMAQLTQKTNQFNLTTRRYTESDIHGFIISETADVYALEVSDKYGESGVTALAIVKLEKDNAEIDTFLMSCRILGRNIEFRFMDALVSEIDQGKINATYIKTAKNFQVKHLYEGMGFDPKYQSGKETRYTLEKGQYIFGKYDYIQLTYGSTN